GLCRCECVGDVGDRAGDAGEAALLVEEVEPWGGQQPHGPVSAVVFLVQLVDVLTGCGDEGVGAVDDRFLVDRRCDVGPQQLACAELFDAGADGAAAGGVDDAGLGGGVDAGVLVACPQLGAVSPGVLDEPCGDLELVG